MVRGRRSKQQVLTLLRKAARDRGYTVERVTGKGGRTRGKGSHELWAVYDRQRELARGSLTSHPGDLSPKVAANFEKAFETIFGEGWMDR